MRSTRSQPPPPHHSSALLTFQTFNPSKKTGARPQANKSDEDVNYYFSSALGCCSPFLFTPRPAAPAAPHQHQQEGGGGGGGVVGTTRGGGGGARRRASHDQQRAAARHQPPTAGAAQGARAAQCGVVRTTGVSEWYHAPARHARGIIVVVARQRAA